MKTAIIGLGWLGAPLAGVLTNEGYEISGSSTNDEKLKELRSHGVDCYKYDLAENTTLPDVVKTETQILVITIPPVNRKEYLFYGDKLVELASQFKSLQKVVFMSSISVYPNSTSLYDEEFLFLENESKTLIRHAEGELEKVFGDKLLILRLGGLFGPGRHPALVLQGRDDLENPMGVVNLVHRDDVMRAVVHLLNEGAAGIINVVNPEHPWRKEYYTHTYRKYDLEPINFIISPTIEKQIDTTKIRKEFGFKFEHSIYDLEGIL